MKWMFKTKEIIRNFYERYDRYLNALVRFVFALSAFMAIMLNTGYRSALTNPFIAIVLAFVCALLPLPAIAVCSAVLIIAEFTAVSLELTAITVILFLVMLLVYFVFRAGNSWLMVLTFTLCLFGLYPAILPVALLISPVEIIVTVFGVIVYGLIAAVKKDVSVLSSAGTMSLGDRVNLLLTDLFANERILLILLTLAAAMLLICVIRKSRLNYASVVAVISGDVLFILTYLFGAYLLKVPFSIWRLLSGILINALFSAIVLGFVISLDYRRTEFVQFEDDDYYYFVKAIPKVTIALQEKRVQNITKETAENESVLGDFDVSGKDLFVRRDDAGYRQEEK